MKPAHLPSAIAAWQLLSFIPLHAADYFFDVNGTTAGSGVVDGSSHAAGGSIWNTLADGTGTITGTVGTAFRGHTLVFSAGTDAAGASYTMTGFGTSYQMTGIRIEEGNVSLVGGSGFSGPTVLTKTGTSLGISGNWDFYGKWNTFNTEASSTVTFANLPNVSSRAAMLRKSGDGLLIVEGAATGRNIQIEALGGEFRIRNNNAMWTNGYTSTVTVNGGTLSLDNNITVSNNPVTISGNGTAAKGALFNHAGNNQYNSLITLAADSSIRAAAGSSLTLNPAAGSSVTGAFGITFGGAGNISIAKPVESVTSFTKSDTGTTTLSATNTYTGTTTISGGVLELTGSGSINSTSGLTLAAGTTFLHNSSVAYTGGAITNNGGTIGGTGTIGVAVALDSTADILAPGNSPGIQTYAASQSWNGFTYEWETKHFNGTTAGTDFDRISITGSLDLTGSSAGSYVLGLRSLDAGNSAGNVPDFSEISRSWNILTTTAGITGFDPGYWMIDASGFSSNPAWQGSWSLALGNSGNDLILSYTPVPETRTALLGALGVLVMLRRRLPRSLPVSSRILP